MIRFAVFTDFHHDLIHDGEVRMKELIHSLSTETIDFVVFLGDLCRPYPEYFFLMDALHSLNIPIYCTIGNHDIEYSNKEAVTTFYGIPNDYYSFTYENTKFLIMSGNYIQKKEGYQIYSKPEYDNRTDLYPIIPPAEKEWLLQEMSDPTMQYAVFSHHSFANEFPDRGIKNQADIRRIFESRNTLFCMNGHDHGDECRFRGGIPYITLNSASYIWHGTKEIFSYSEEIHQRAPLLKYMILYDRPLYCTITIDGSQVSIHGKKGDYQTITPEDAAIGNTWNGVPLRPAISDYTFSIQKS